MRPACRAALITLLTVAQSVLVNVGNEVRGGDIITCVEAVIAQIEAI